MTDTREQVLEQADMLERDGYGNAARMLKDYALRNFANNVNHIWPESNGVAKGTIGEPSGRVEG